MGTLVKNRKKDWKSVAVQRREVNHRLCQEVKRQKQRAEKWRGRYYVLKKETSLTKVARHKYPVELIWLAIWMRISANISLRGVSQSLVKLGELYGLHGAKFSPSNIRNWCLKYGLYALFRPIPKGKYVLICDESIEIGREHLMLILAVPVGISSSIVPLRMSDVLVLDMSVQESWKGEELAQMIESKRQKYDLEFVYGISDQGHVLKNAYKRCQITWVGDCTHQIANVTKSLFKKDEAFNTFIKQLNGLRAKWVMSKNNLYIPPALRAKTRFHQLFVVHKWAKSILQQWSRINKDARLELAFIQKNRTLITTMEHFYDLINCFANLFKSAGIQSNSMLRWQLFCQAYRKENNLEQKTIHFIDQMNNYLKIQQAKFEAETQILCCSDIIESMFGKYKNKGGMKMITEDVLHIAAYGQNKESKQVMQAMQQVKIKDILEWKKQNTTTSKLALIKKTKTKTRA